MDPKARNAKAGTGSLNREAALAGWATPCNRDFRHPNALAYSERGGGTKGEQLANQAVHLAGWPSPTALSFADSHQPGTNRFCERVKELAGWGTPRVPTNSGAGNAARSHRSRLGSSFWSRADLIHCTDGKARRVESGTFPLAHGVPDRVGLLRGYGNAIVPQVAAEFIRASREALTLL